MSNDLIPRSTVEEIVGYRNKALDLFAEAHTALATADAAVKAAHDMARRAYFGKVNGYTYSQADEVKAFEKAIQLPERDRYLRTARKLIDCSVWAGIIRYTDLERLMDKAAKDELYDQMQYVPDRVDRNGQLITGEEAAKGLPPVTVENVQATLEHFRASADMIFRRGIANAFSKLDRRFRSHDGFKIGSRIILSYAFDGFGSWRWNYGHRDTLIDIERTFMILDGRFNAATYSTVIGEIERDRRGSYGPQYSEHVTPYFKVRVYKNGNAHLWFTRKDLVAKVNQILADWYGEVIGDGMTKEADPFANPTTLPAKRYGYYPTADHVAREIVEKLGLYQKPGAPPIRVLEPSAGGGALARLCAAERTGCDYDNGRKEYSYRPLVDCVEIQPHLAEELEAEGIYNRVWCRDFLSLTPEVTGLYDVVAMNPPFDLERDIDHVVHALKFLKPTGKLTAIMSAGTEFRETKKAVAFRELMESLNASWRDLPPGSFAHVGTYVNTVVVRVRKDGLRSHY